jgi:Ser/Thr protein kinase RdoA (MazF antagonist)
VDIDDLQVIGRGRSSLVFDHRDGTVIRRHHNAGYDATAEAAAMGRAAAAGVPVPLVHDVSGPDIRMDRVDGPTLMEQLITGAVSPAEAGSILAGLHRALDATAADGLTKPPAALVHGDLHPGNVIITAGGPVLIDWTNQREDVRGLDVAISWIVLTCFDPDDSEEPAALRTALDDHRRPLVESMLAGLDRHAATAALPAAVALRCDDRSTSDLERTRMDQLLGADG